MKTIAIDIRMIGKKRTGDETVFFHLTKALMAEDTENRYCLLTDERDPAALAELRGRLGCAGKSAAGLVSLWGRNRFFWNLVSVPLYLLRTNVNIYHTQYILPFFIPRRTKAVTLVHDVSFRAYPALIGRADRFFLWLLFPRSLTRADRVLTPSQFTKDEIIKYYGLPPEKISVIPNAAQDVFLVTAEEMSPAVRKKYRLPEQYALYVGTLQPRKNVPFLLEAFAQVSRRLPDLRLVIVGNRAARHVDPRIEETLKREKLEEKVIFPGYVAEEDLPAVVKQASFFVYPSLYEGFGIPLLEAMSQGVPVVAADIPSLREVAGEAAAWARPGDIADLAEKMYNFSIESDIQNRFSFIERGKRQVSLYSWKISARKLREVYQSL